MLKLNLMLQHQKSRMQDLNTSHVKVKPMDARFLEEALY